MKSFSTGYLLCLAVFTGLLCSAGNPVLAADPAASPWIVSSQPFGLLTMPELVKPPPADKKLFLKITAGYQYDTNVILNAQGAPVPEGIGKKDDSRFVLNLAGTYLPLKGPRGDLALNYAFFQSQHGELDDFNLTQNMAELAGRYRLDDRFTVRFSTLFQHLQLGSKLFDYALVVGPSLIISEGQGTSTAIDLRYRMTEYENVAIFRSNAIRSGDNYLGGVTQTVPLSPTVQLRAGYAIDADDTRSPRWDGLGHKASLEGSFILPHDSLLDIYAEYYRKDYQGVYASIGGKRTDNGWSAVVTATTYFQERYGVSLRALYTRNISKVPAFDISRFIPSILFDARF
jgi:hypothetical protein